MVGASKEEKILQFIVNEIQRGKLLATKMLASVITLKNTPLRPPMRLRKQSVGSVDWMGTAG